MARVLVQKSDESTKLFERLSAKNGKDWSITQRAKAWMRYSQRAEALDCVSAGVEDGIRHQTQTPDVGSKDLDVVEQYPEALTPTGKMTGEQIQRWAPDLNSPWYQACMAEPESMEVTSTEDPSVQVKDAHPTARRTARRRQADLPVITDSKDSHRLPGGYVLGSVVFSKSDIADGTARRGELGIVVQAPSSAAESGSGQKRKFRSHESGVWVCFGRAQAQKRCDDLLIREQQRVHLRELVWKQERDQTRRKTTAEGVGPSLEEGEWWMEPIPDCLVSTFKEDWAPVLRKVIEEDKGEPHLVSIGDISSHDTASEFRRDTEGTL
jgi:hypothetical protein